MAEKDVYRTLVMTENAEPVESIVIRKTTKSSEAFFQAYCEDLGALNRCTPAQVKVLISIITQKFVEFNTNEIIMNANRRDMIVQKEGLSIGAIYNAISGLKKKNMIIKQGKRIYLNPKMFFYGYEVERERMLNLTIQYEICPEC